MSGFDLLCVKRTIHCRLGRMKIQRRTRKMALYVAANRSLVALYTREALK